MTTEERQPHHHSRLSRIVAVAIAILGFLYLAQLFGPLRLDFDAVRYFLLAMSLTDGTPLPNLGLPLGYPHIIEFLTRAGLGRNEWFVPVNCAFLALGFASFARMNRDRPGLEKLLTVFFTLLCFEVVMLATAPLSENVYFGLSFLSLSLMLAAQQGRLLRRSLFIGLALCAAVGATSVRLVGVTLVPALLVASWTSFRVSFERRHWLTLGAAGATLLIPGVVFLMRSEDNGTFSHYTDYAANGYTRSLGRVILRQGRFGLNAMGELGANIPVGHSYWFDRFLPLFGAITVAVLLLGWRQSRLAAPLTTYLVSYVGTIAVWPFYGVRLWMPIVPLLVLCSIRAYEHWRTHKAVRYFGYVYAAWFVLAGMAAIADSTRLAFSSDYFAAEYRKQRQTAAPRAMVNDPGYRIYLRSVIDRYDPDNAPLYDYGSQPSDRPR